MGFGIRRRAQEPPGEWQLERTQYGGFRRFRWTHGGTVKEYECTVITSYGRVPQSCLEAANRAEAARREAALHPERDPEQEGGQHNET